MTRIEILSYFADDEHGRVGVALDEMVWFRDVKRIDLPRGPFFKLAALY